jgi:hypothetical protein
VHRHARSMPAVGARVRRSDAVRCAKSRGRGRGSHGPRR